MKSSASIFASLLLLCACEAEPIPFENLGDFAILPDVSTRLDFDLVGDAATADAGLEADAAADADADLSDAAAPETDAAGSAADLDWIDDVSCMDTQRPPASTCEGEGSAETREDRGGAHISEGPIEYEVHPPASGPHRPQWGKWGEHSYLPPQNWVHNLEHGGVVFLHHPCANPVEVSALYNVAANYQPTDGEPFRWILTPYPDLPTSIAVVAWRHVYSAPCTEPAAIEAFIADHYDEAPESSGADGAYDRGWLRR